MRFLPRGEIYKELISTVQRYNWIRKKGEPPLGLPDALPALGGSHSFGKPLALRGGTA